MDWQFDRCGGHLALDFANTVSGRETTSPIDRIPGYADLVKFAAQSGLVSAGQAATLLKRAGHDREVAAAAHGRAVALRDSLYDLCAAVVRDHAPAVDDVETLDRELARLCIGMDLSLAWRDEPEALDGFLGAIVHAAVMLLTSEAERKRVKICEAADCVWLFYDTSKNRSRRWCDMRQCGNRMKARRHYAKGKRTQSST